MPAVPRDRWGGGAVAQCHPAKKGGRGHARRPFGRKPRGQVIGRPGWKPLLMREGLIEHGMEEMNALVRMRWGHPKELSLDCLDGMLFQVGQHEEPFVRYPE
jgi:hypothetical protein